MSNTKQRAREPRTTLRQVSSTRTLTSERVYDFLRVYRAVHGIPPATHEVASGLGINKSLVHHHLQRLVADGRLRQFPGSRGYVAVENEEAPTIGAGAGVLSERRAK